MRTGRDVCLPGDLPEYILWHRPVQELDLRPRGEVESPCYLQDEYCVRIILSIVSDSGRERHRPTELVQTPRERHAFDNSTAKVQCIWASTCRSVSVCNPHVSDGSSHIGWRGDHVVCRKNLASDHSGGRVRGGSAVRSMSKPREV